MDEQDKPKIIVDSDWKAQAQAEKQKLADQELKRPRQQAAGPGSQAPDLPKASFEELVRLLVGPALMYLGGVPDPQTGKAIVALDVARYHIDLLKVIEDKTKGNLSEQESQTITQVLHELRLRYIEMEKLVSKAALEGATTIEAPGAPPSGP